MDVADLSWNKFFGHRTKPLWERFPGYYRAVVKEINDPLALNRIKFLCPDIHDADLKAEECPWAVPSNEFGGKKSGKFATPCIGDWVWISFEKQHPFAPVWTGFATPLKKKYYVPAFVAEIPEKPLSEVNKPLDYKDYDPLYLPKDGRPLVYGYQDRYGNLDISSNVGYYPIEHDIAPPTPDIDPVNKNILGNTLSKPQVNNPDKKFMLKATKYGNILILGDQGYYWKKEGEYGEFTGDVEKDDKFESKRYLYLQRLVNEDNPDTTKPNTDQRRAGLYTRYGHKIEARDTGWAQPGPTPSKSRKDELGDPVYLSKETKADMRWIKLRTKGGMLFQQSDKGSDPATDAYIQRNLIDEVGFKTEQEDKYWADRDARWMRMVSRWGIKFVIDDRGSDKSKAEQLEVPSGNGVLIKGRKSPSSKNKAVPGTPKGYYWEFNENEELNHTSWGSPNGQTIEINDRYQYMIMASRLGNSFAADWQGLKENEFIGKPVMSANPEINTHHMKIDIDNEYIRFKTRANNGESPIDASENSGVDAGSINQGMEARDGASGDGPWVELVDSQNRGIWLSKKYNLGVWRSTNDIFMLMDDGNKRIVIQNNEVTGSIEIYSTSSVNIISGESINIQAGGDINMRAGGAINFASSGTDVTFSDDVHTTGQMFAKFFLPIPGANPVASVTKTNEYTILSDAAIGIPLAPSDRAKTYNGPYDIPDRKTVIEHRT